MKYKFEQICRHFRRWCLVIFKPKYVMYQLATRKGECGMHSECCEVMDCEHKGNNICLNWDNCKWKFWSRLYPIDEKDMTPFSKQNCNFYWKK